MLWTPEVPGSGLLTVESRIWPAQRTGSLGYQSLQVKVAGRHVQGLTWRCRARGYASIRARWLGGLGPPPTVVERLSLERAELSVFVAGEGQTGLECVKVGGVRCSPEGARRGCCERRSHV